MPGRLRRWSTCVDWGRRWDGLTDAARLCSEAAGGRDLKRRPTLRANGGSYPGRGWGVGGGASQGLRAGGGAKHEGSRGRDDEEHQPPKSNLPSPTSPGPFAPHGVRGSCQPWFAVEMDRFGVGGSLSRVASPYSRKSTWARLLSLVRDSQDRVANYRASGRDARPRGPTK